jgi:ribosomal protein S1
VLGAGTVNDEGNTVTITRPGGSPVVYDISDGSEADCRDAVIEPGDVVEVSVHQAERGYVELTLGAGKAYGCTAQE